MEQDKEGQKMLKIFKCGALLIAAAFCLGFVYKAYSYHSQYELRKVYFHEIVRRGDTFQGIIGEYYNPKLEEPWNEWSFKQATRNRAILYYEDGSARMLQPGDIVCIECRIEIKKDQ